jgi:TPR repeat protein
MLHTVRNNLPLVMAASLAMSVGAALADDQLTGSSLLPADQLYFRALYLEQNGRAREALAVLTEASNKPGPKMETGGKNGLPMDSYQRKALAELGKIYLAPGPLHNTGKGVAALVRGALLGDDGAATRLAKLELEEGVVPPELPRLIPIYMAQARASSNTCALVLAKLAAEGKLGRGGGTAMSWYEIAARRGSNKAIEYIVVSYVASGNDSAALGWIKRLKKDAGSVYLSIAKDFLTDGDQLKRNIPAAVDWYKRALAAVPAVAARSANRFMELAGDADKATILAAVREVADRGDADAALVVAKALDRGDPTRLDPDAVHYYVIAAKAANPDAVTGLVRAAAFVKSGQPITKELVDGVTAAADKGSTDAMLAVANLYAVGTLVDQNIGQSFSWYLKAAKAGNPEAEFRAGMAYAQGLGTSTDIGEAKRWLTAANDHGYALAGPSLQSLK